MLDGLSYRHISVVRDEYAVSDDGMKLFGVLDLETTFDEARCRPASMILLKSYVFDRKFRTLRNLFARGLSAWMTRDQYKVSSALTASKHDQHAGPLLPSWSQCRNENVLVIG